MMQPTDGLDPRLQKWFEGLRPTPPRNPQRAAQGLESFLQEARSLGRPVFRGSDRRRIGWIGFLASLTSKENRSMIMVAALLMSIVLFVGGGLGVTAYAAQGALPGDTLYGIKTGLEDAQLALSPTAAGDFELHMQFAAERLREITALVAEGRYEDAHTAVDALAYQLSQASEALRVVAEEDPILATELASRYGNFVTESRETIAALVLSAPEGAQEVLRDTLGVLEAAFGALGKYYTGDDDLVDDADKRDDEADKPDVYWVDKPDDDAAEPDDHAAEPDDHADEPDDDAAEPDDDADEPDDDAGEQDDDAGEPDDDTDEPDDDDDNPEPDDTEEPDDDVEEPDDDEPEGSDD